MPELRENLPVTSAISTEPSAIIAPPAERASFHELPGTADLDVPGLDADFGDTPVVAAAARWHVHACHAEQVECRRLPEHRRAVACRAVVPGAHDHVDIGGTSGEVLIDVGLAMRDRYDLRGGRSSSRTPAWSINLNDQ